MLPLFQIHKYINFYIVWKRHYKLYITVLFQSFFSYSKQIYFYSITERKYFFVDIHIYIKYIVVITRHISGLYNIDVNINFIANR